MEPTYEVDGEIVRETAQPPEVVKEYARSDMEQKLSDSIERRDQKALELAGAQSEVDRLQEILGKFPQKVEAEAAILE